jgi:hypothetical protein
MPTRHLVRQRVPPGDVKRLGSCPTPTSAARCRCWICCSAWMRRRCMSSSGARICSRSRPRSGCENGARSLEAARRVGDHIRVSFAGQAVPRSDYEHLVVAMPGDDPDDRHHAAAVVGAKTRHRRDRQPGGLSVEPLAALEGVYGRSRQLPVCILASPPERGCWIVNRDGSRRVPTPHDHSGGCQCVGACRRAQVRQADQDQSGQNATPRRGGSSI